MLAMMDGVTDRGQVVVIGATNRPDALDGALRRPGRFDREVEFPAPDFSERLAILKVWTRRWKPRPSDSLLRHIADRTQGLSGADIKGVCDKANIENAKRIHPNLLDAEGVRRVKELNFSDMVITDIDFERAIAAMKPARLASSMSRSIDGEIQRPLVALLRPQLALVKSFVRSIVTAPENLSWKERKERIVSGKVILFVEDGGRAENFVTEISVPVALHELGVPVTTINVEDLLRRAGRFHDLFESVSALVETARRTAPGVLFVPHADALLDRSEQFAERGSEGVWELLLGCIAGVLSRHDERLCVVATARRGSLKGLERAEEVKLAPPGKKEAAGFFLS